MLDSRHDAPSSDEEWQSLLLANNFGQLVAVDASRSPIVVPLHFWFDGDSRVEGHLHRQNLLWAALRSDARACLSVIAAHVFIPGHWNAEEQEASDWGAPTSYYAAVQVSGPVEIIDDAEGLASLLTRQMKQMQPEGGYGAVETGDNPFGRMFPGIIGFRLSIQTVHTKFKFGGNRTHSHRFKVAELLRQRGELFDIDAREHLLRRTESVEGKGT